MGAHQSTYKGEIFSSKKPWALGSTDLQSQACGTSPPHPDSTTTLGIITLPRQDSSSSFTRVVAARPWCPQLFHFSVLLGT